MLLAPQRSTAGSPPVDPGVVSGGFGGEIVLQVERVLVFGL